MRKIKSILSALFCLIVLQSGSVLFAAPKTKVRMPDWVNNPSSVYPKSAYISYVGSGADKKSAELDAIKGVASVFGQSIKSETKASSRMVQAQENGMVATAKVASIDQSVKKVVDIDSLIGVELSDTWFDEASTWYAIAVLNKEKTSLIYQDMLNKNIKTVSALVDRIDEDNFSFDSYALYDFAEDILRENEKLLQRLSIIDMDAASSLENLAGSSKDVHAKKMDLAKKIPIYIIVENDVDGRFEEAFNQAISKAGFRATLDSSVQYVLYAKFDFNRSETSDNKTVRCKYNGETFILDKENGQQIIPYSLSGRESHVMFSEAKDKAVKKIIQTIISDYPKSMDNFLKELIVD